MKIALTQMEIVWEDKDANWLTVERLVAESAKAGARMVIFPEMTLTGFSMAVERTGEAASDDFGLAETAGAARNGSAWEPGGARRDNPASASERSNSIPYVTETCRRMLALSRRYSLVIVFGYVRKSADRKYYNCLMAVERGMVLAQYDKLHPFTFGEEGRYFTGGNHLAKCQVDGLRVGFAICYDLRFPEVFQALSGTCACIVVIANWPGARAEHWRVLLQARAIENQCYLLGVNRRGEGGGLSYEPVSSMAFDPYGRSLPAEESAGGLLLVDVDGTAAEEYRKDFPLKSDRRVELYRRFYEEES